MSETTMVTSRTIDGAELPAAGTYKIDEAHTNVGFVVRHMAVSRVRGQFAKVDGTLVVGEDPTASSIQVTIDSDSVDTRDETRDNHVRTADFLDVANHPTITFTSTAVRPVEAGSWQVEGDLTVRGTTRPVVLDVTLEGVVQDPYGNHRAGFSARTEINREDFGVSFGAVMEAGGLVVAKKVAIEIEAEAVYQA
ncbi:MAG: YceI family protein [Acidimicrobiales bacterium]